LENKDLKEKLIRSGNLLFLALMVWLILICAAPIFPQNTRARRPPNIIFIWGDDLGWREPGVYGNRFNETPNLDRMANEGVRFTNAYAASPICSPTRASLPTGKYLVKQPIANYLEKVIFAPNFYFPINLLTLPTKAQLQEISLTSLYAMFTI
jgi:Sulfatase